MDQAVIKLYRKLLAEDFPNAGEMENASVFVEAIGQHMINCGETGNYMQLYLKTDGSHVTDIRYLCSCEPVANVAVEILCGLVRGRTIEEAASLDEELFFEALGSRDKALQQKVQGLLELLGEAITAYRDK